MTQMFFMAQHSTKRTNISLVDVENSNVVVFYTCKQTS